MVVGVAGALAQGGFYLATKSIKPKFSKLNPIKGVKRIFGLAVAVGGRQDAAQERRRGRPGLGRRQGAHAALGGLVPIPVVLAAVSARRRRR